MKATLLCALLGLVVLTGCNNQGTDTAPTTPEATTETAQQNATAPAQKQTTAPAPGSTAPASEANEVAIMRTTEGDMVFEFWPEVAPKTVANFKKLAKEDFYNGTSFHRIVDGFMIQGGDFLSKDPANEAQFGTGNPGFTVPAEFSDRKHVRGVLSMARLGHDINSASSQFFIVLAPAEFLDGSYTAFGKMIKGDDVLEKIAKTPVTFSRGERSKPTKRIEIQSVEIVPRDQVQ
ncbi:MAG: peptidylprolyl isomerase [Limisphaerales bacterium]